MSKINNIDPKATKGNPTEATTPTLNPYDDFDPNTLSNQNQSAFYGFMFGDPAFDATDED